MIKVSVIIPIYNAKATITQAVESIIHQTLEDIEILLINDNSTDSTLYLCNKLADRDSRIKIIHNTWNNKGQTQARNLGLKKAKGFYIAMQDADDYSRLNRLEVQYTYLENHPNIFLVGTNGRLLDSLNIKKQLPHNNVFVHGSIMFRSVGYLYDEVFRRSQDYELYLRLIGEGRALANISANFYIHEHFNSPEIIRDQAFYRGLAKVKHGYLTPTEFIKDYHRYCGYRFREDKRYLLALRSYLLGWIM